MTLHLLQHNVSKHACDGTDAQAEEAIDPHGATDIGDGFKIVLGEGVGWAERSGHYD